MVSFNNTLDNCSIAQIPPMILPYPIYYRILLSILPSLLACFTILGNAFVIIAIRTSKRLRRKRTSILIFNLALADFLVGSGVMPFGVSLVADRNQWMFGRVMCKIWTCLDVICCTASIFTLCIISVDRWIGVTRPLRYSSIVTRGRLWCAVILVWILSCTVLLATVKWTENPCVDIFVCKVGNELEYVAYSVIMSFFIPLIIILFVHYKIYQVAKRREIGGLIKCPSTRKSNGKNWRMKILTGGIYGKMTKPAMVIRTGRNLSESGSAGGQSPADSRKGSDFGGRNRIGKRGSGTQSPLLPRGMSRGTLRVHYGGTEDEDLKRRKFYAKHKKAAKTLAMVVGAFLFCWLPFFIVYLIGSTCTSDCIPSVVMEAFTWLGYTNSAINPVLYAVSMKAFGTDMFQTLCRIASCLGLSKFQQQPQRRGTILLAKHRLSALSSSVAVPVVTERSASTSNSLNGAYQHKCHKNGKLVTVETDKDTPIGKPAAIVRVNPTNLQRNSPVDQESTVEKNLGRMDYGEMDEQTEDEDLSYAHFGPCCQDDFELESSRAVAAIIPYE